MQKRSWSLGLAAIALSSPAIAQDNERDRGTYIGADLGGILVEDFDTDIGTAIEDATSSGDTGWGASVQLGHDWGRIRTEIEGSYQSFGADAIDSAAQGIPTGVESLATGPQDYDGDFTLTSLMANALVDFGGADDVQFSIGAGAGRTWMNADAEIPGSAQAHLDTSDSEWAWQGLAQLRIPVADRVDLGLKYRYFSSLEFEVDDTLGRLNDFELATHTLSASLVVYLGGDEAPLAPPAPPPPPVQLPPPPPPPVPPAPVPPCNSGPYIVFFDWDESTITPEAASVLNSAISAYGNCGTSRIMLAGHADRSGPATYNVRLSERRNATVVDYLTVRNIPAGRISTEAFGESAPRVETADGVRELQNRRVEITYGPGSGN
ncbi:OmpA family protein [Aurantiacibacter sp. D1-12]|uniref:OmpA family protein n=1 Tax=Aurantiacibacter sp. D1-12 TaxID=2993658 RepID=UPI00237C8817|nr:OmpA family protein [Aurantiacibacter sp. D1-12]MDE1468584.1 OmpA family protein [Aurantiacibacter sp. D1-12]